MIGWLAGALRRQDWIAVVIELLTVMFGLFLGLQLDAWNDARKARIREHDALVRLEQESEASVIYFRRTIAQFDRLTASQRAVIVALQSGNKLQFTGAQLAETIESIGFYPGIAVPRAVYDELSRAGMLSDIRSNEVRTVMAQYYARLGFIDSQLQYFRQSQIADSAIGERAITATLNPVAGKNERPFVETADFDAIAGDKAVMTTLVHGLRDQVVFQFYRREAETAAITMCKTLARALNKSCAAAVAPVRPHRS
ncbi:MAG: hypothetical protein JSR60_01200 [Proteobacteria bacterium]|nr:hypothetical protein [Pseudomonadota bacterium]